MAIKLLDNSVRFDVISQYDDSIDGKSEAGDAAFSKYMETLDKADLIFKPEAGDATVFVVRCLTSTESADMQVKHMVIDATKKTRDFKHGYSQYLIDVFGLACLGIKKTDGSLQKVTADDVGLLHALSIGSSIALLTTLGKNLKNV